MVGKALMVALVMVAPRYREKGKHMFDVEPEACCIRIVDISWMRTRDGSRKLQKAAESVDVFQIRTRN